MSRKLYTFLLVLMLLPVMASAVTVTMTTPKAGSTVSSPVQFAATASSSSAITGWRIYDGSTSVYNVNGTSIPNLNASVSLATGSHSMTVRAWDATGAFGSQVFTINVATAGSGGVTVSVSTPVNGGSYVSPVQFKASATSSNSLAGWHIYVDSAVADNGTLSGSSISTSINMSTGSHAIIVRAWDSSGAYGSASMSINVGSSTPTSGGITGTVTDSSGTAISGATVKWNSGSTTTNSSGGYTLSNVTAGSVSVTASATGFNSLTQTVTVNGGQTTTNNFVLTSTSSGSGGSTGGTGTTTSDGTTTIICGQPSDGLVHVPVNYNSFTPPAAGGTYVDQAYGCTIKRLTDASSGTWGQPVHHEYSVMPAVNSNDTFVLVRTDTTGYSIINMSGGVVAAPHLSALSEAVWSRTDPDVLYYHTNGGNAILSYNVATQTSTTVHTFSQYSSIVFGNQETDLSDDGNHITVAGDCRYLGIYTFSTGTESATVDLNAISGQTNTCSSGGGNGIWDYADMTHDNKVVLRWSTNGSGRAHGIELYDQNMNFVRQVTPTGSHSDRGVDTDGSSAIFLESAPTSVCGSSSGIYKINLTTFASSCVFKLGYYTGIAHMSYGNGWVAYSINDGGSTQAYGTGATTGWHVYSNEVVIVSVDGQHIYRMFHHRSRSLDSYWYAPRASLSADGQYLVFDSNYNMDPVGSDYTDVYVVKVGQISSPGGTTTTGTVTGTVTNAQGAGVGGATVKWSGGQTTTSSTSGAHIFVVAEENTSYGSVVGNTGGMPYFNNTMIPKGALFSNAYADVHGSLLDYLFVTSGADWTQSPYNCTGNQCGAPTNGIVTGDNIVRAMINNGLTWKGYFEDMPYEGYTGFIYNNYYERHNPFPWYSDVASSSAQTNNMYPFTQFSTDLTNHSFGTLTWITPNMNDDMHNGTPTQADTWLQNNIGPLLASSYFQPGGDGILIIWFDEGDLSTDNACSPTVSTGCGGHVPLLIIGPKVKTAYTSTDIVKHGAVLRFVLKAMGITDLMGTAGTSPDITDILSAGAFAQSGSYTLSNVTSGAQTITASATGYNSASNNVTVPVSGTATSNFVLSQPSQSTGSIVSCSPETLACESGDNTSAANTWPTSTNNDYKGSANISKVDINTLLYSGNTTWTAPNFLLWWCASSPGNVSTTTLDCSHIQIGYTSNDVTQVHAQMDDILSRGFSGVVIDWYGRGNNDFTATNENATALKVVADLNARSGTPLKFAMMFDHIYTWSCGSGHYVNLGYSDITTCMYSEINKDLDYANLNYFNQPTTYKVNGHPIVQFFIIESGSEFSGTNWTTVWSNVASHAATLSNGSPYLLFNTPGFGFTHVNTNGGWAWVNNTEQLAGAYANDDGATYAQQFYTAAHNNPTMQVWGGGWKGFNDSLAAWGSGRVMNQNCGHTLMDSMAQATFNNYFGTSNQLPQLQISTWNDYEEGSEVETGIDSCNAISSSLTGSTLNWTISGTGFTDTIDHFTVYYSTDQNNLTVLQDGIAPSARSLNLSNYSFNANGTIYLYVKMVSKPMMSNSMSTAQTYNVKDQPPYAAVTVQPTSGTAPLIVTADTSGSGDADGTALVSRRIDWGDSTGPTVLTGTTMTATHTYTSSGTFNVTVTVTDVANLTATTNTTVTVGTSVSSNVATINIINNGDYVYSPFRVLGQVQTVNPPISHARIYVDGQVVYDVPFNGSVYNVDKYVFLSVDSWHTIYIEGVDNNGNVFDSTAMTVYCVGHVY